MRLLIGTVLCAVALVVFVGCPDGSASNSIDGDNDPLTDINTDATTLAEACDITPAVRGQTDRGCSDTSPPVLTLRGLPAVTVELGVGFTDPGATVTDNDINYAGAVTVATTGSGVTIIGAIITYTATGTYTITYTAPADAAGLTPVPAMLTRTVRVQDTTAPVIRLAGAAIIPVNVGEAVPTDPGATATDNDPAYGMGMGMGGMVPATPVITDGSGNVITTIDTSITGDYIITYTADTDANGNVPDDAIRIIRVSVDIDGDTLIDIRTIDAMNAIRYNLAGTSYRANNLAPLSGSLCGIAGTVACTGYELVNALDFAEGTSYADGTVNPAWRPNNTLDPDSATNPGWSPIGACNTDTDGDDLVCSDSDDDPFATRFVGNGFTISNLYVQGDGLLGLFAVSSGSIDNVGIVDANIYGRAGSDVVGGLIGRNGGTITSSYATGNVNGRNGVDRVGGLIGENDGTVIMSYATGGVDGGAGIDSVGGLTGQNSGVVTLSYATGDVDSGNGFDFIGGLVGNNNSSGTITASYATGDVDGGAEGDGVGGLIGLNRGGIVLSYATGDINGGDGTDTIGGLVGDNAENSTITASYATGDITGGDANDFVGGLTGVNGNFGIITASYATGDIDGGAGTNRGGILNNRNIENGTTIASYGFGTLTATTVRTPPLHITRSDDASPSEAVADECDITQINSSTTPGNRWNAAQWDFGTTGQHPVVLYNGTPVPGQTDRGGC